MIFDKKEMIGTVAFNQLGTGQIVYTSQDNEGFIKLYTSNTDLFSVINYLWVAANKIDIVVRGRDGEVKENGDLYQLIQRPNPRQSWDEFFKQYGEYKSVLGNSYIWPIKLTGNRFKEMYVLPAQYTKIIADKGMMEVKGYKVEVNGGWSKNLAPDEVIHVRESNLRCGSGAELYGMSRLMPGSKTVDTNQAAQDANASRLHNRGVEALVTVKGVDNAAQGMKEGQRLKDQFKKLISGSSKAGGVAVTGREVEVHQFGIKATDLGTFEAQKKTLHQLCSLYLVPPILLDPTTGNTYNNIKETDKALYNNAAIPEVQQFVQSFNAFIGDTFGGDKLDFDTSGIEALQANMKEMAEWVAKAPITLNEGREVLGYEPVDDPVADELMVDMNRIGIGEVNEDELKNIKDYK